jgi:hypothetical protein
MTETRQRTEYLIARATPEEKATVQAEADRRGVRVGELVRTAVLAAVTDAAVPVRPPGCRCRQPGVAIHLACPVHSPYPDVRRGLPVEVAQEIAADARQERAEDAADREERPDA